MVMNMKKLCVGILSIEQLIASNDRRSEPDHPKTGEDFIYITTRSRPQKWESMVNGGSLYWIIDRRLCCRQEIIDFREGNKQDGTPAWHIDLRAEVISCGNFLPQTLPGLAVFGIKSSTQRYDSLFGIRESHR